MTNVVNFPEQSRIKEEASRWLIRLDGGPLSDEETILLSAWLDNSQEHRDAIVELCKLWDNMEIMSELSILFPYNNKASPKLKGDYPVKKPAYLIATVSASILVAILSTLLYQFGLDGILVKSPNQKEIAYQTVIGEQKDVLLEDGSIANLNTDSLVIVSSNDKQRNIRLIRGEAYFEVAHDPSRPFFVYAGSGLVRAVGTAFSVRIKGQNIEVIVTEGKVEVASVIPDQTEGFDDLTAIISDEYLTTLSVGQTAEFSEKKINIVETIEPEVMSRKLSWQHGMLEFKGETLERVVREISRYTDKEIIIVDASIRDIRIGGYFKTGEVDALLTVLKDGFPVTINRVNDNLIYLSEGSSVQTIN